MSFKKILLLLTLMVGIAACNSSNSDSDSKINLDQSKIESSVVGGNGDTIDSQNFIMTAVVAEPATGQSLISTNYRLKPGFINMTFGR